MNTFTSKTFVCHILKKENANKLKDFKPINLITCFYKILTKVLANHLKGVLPSTIFELQKAFIAWRQILDQTLIANEANEDYRIKKKGLILKLILEKLTILWIGISILGFG